MQSARRRALAARRVLLLNSERNVYATAFVSIQGNFHPRRAFGTFSQDKGLANMWYLQWLYNPCSDRSRLIN